MASNCDCIVTIEIPTPIVKRPRLIKLRGIDPGMRSGRGYSLRELKQAGLTITTAKQLGVPIDFRRRSLHQHNVDMLKEFLSKISPLLSAIKTKPAKLPQKAQTKELHQVAQ